MSDTPREAAMTDEAGLRMMQRTEEARGCHHLAKALQAGADAIVQLQSLQQRLDEQAHDIDAYRGALGYPMPGSHDGKLSDGTCPRNGIAQALEQQLAERKRGRVVWKCMHCARETTDLDPGTSCTHSMSRYHAWRNAKAYQRQQQETP